MYSVLRVSRVSRVSKDPLEARDPERDRTLAKVLDCPESVRLDDFCLFFRLFCFEPLEQDVDADPDVSSESDEQQLSSSSYRFFPGSSQEIAGDGSRRKRTF